MQIFRNSQIISNLCEMHCVVKSKDIGFSHYFLPIRLQNAIKKRNNNCRIRVNYFTCTVSWLKTWQMVRAFICFWIELNWSFLILIFFPFIHWKKLDFSICSSLFLCVLSRWNYWCLNKADQQIGKNRVLVQIRMIKKRILNTVRCPFSTRIVWLLDFWRFFSLSIFCSPSFSCFASIYEITSCKGCERCGKWMCKKIYTHTHSTSETIKNARN